MNPQKILQLDRYLGRPVCFFLTQVRRIGGWFRRPTNANSPVRKILVIKMIEQGATVIAYRALARAVELVGRENVYFWVFEENRPILDLLDVIPRENVIALRAKKPFTFALDVIASLWRIRRLGIDATVDMEFFARAPVILAYLTGARRRVGLHRFTNEGPYRGNLLTHRVMYNPYLHVSRQYYELVEALHADPRDEPLLKAPLPELDFAPPLLKANPGELDALRDRLARQLGRPFKRLVLLNPNASDMLPLRKWPTERFIELANVILSHHEDVALVITGGPSEQASGDAIAQQINAGLDAPRAISMAGRTTLRELLLLGFIAEVLVTNDSGPGHFASMTPMDTVVMFGPETPALFGPVGPRTHTLYANLACSPCVSALNHRFSPCTNNVCMQKITVEQVYQTVASILARRAGASTSRTLPVLTVYPVTPIIPHTAPPRQPSGRT